MQLRSRKSLVLALVALGLAVGCAEEREPINRVQPNALPKSFFVGEKLLDTTDDPEFWTQATLTDVGYGASQDGLFTSTYAQPLTRVKFTIQENYLIARLTYERIADSDHKGMGAASTDGIIVAVFPIRSHFDIQREYNPVTGEQYNVIGENSSDRPWYEREYMRVDFSRNLNVDSYDFDTLSQIGVFGGVKYESLAYDIKDPSDPDAPHFDVEGGYFDVTNKAFAVPGQIDLRMFGWGIDSFPSCFLEADFMNGSAPSGNCNPVELTIRHSFRRVEDTDYEPQHWDGWRFKAFGAFYSDRKGYARNYMMTDDRWYRFINKYNIWERSHVYADMENMTGAVECYTPETTMVGADPHRDLDKDGTEDECAAVAGMGYQTGSRCDEFTQKCTLPYRDRKDVTQVWYYTTGSDPNYFEGSDWAAHEWDVALRSAVMTARYAECKKTGGQNCEADYPVYSGQQDENDDAVALSWEVDSCRRGLAHAGKPCLEGEGNVIDVVATERGYSEGVKAIARMKEMIVLCHSPVEANDPAVCAAPDQRLPAGMSSAACYQARKDHDAATLEICEKALNARLGDLRYNQVNVIETPQTPSPWGIMVDSVDPYNGQKVATSINAWSYVTDYWAQIVVDQARYVKGELTTEQVTEGEYVKDWSQAAVAAAGGAAPKLTQEQVDQRISEFVGRNVAGLELQNAGVLNDARVRAGLQKARAQVQSIKADARAVSRNVATYNARMQQAQNTEFEASLVTPMMMQYSGAANMLDAGVVTQFGSPLRAANPSVLREMRRMRELALAERGACVLQEAPLPIGVANLADAMEKKFEPIYGKFSAADSKNKQLARAEAMRKWLAQKVHYSVIIHEMGHSVGLRHNFVSSADPFNYRPQYWQLRTLNGSQDEACNGLQTEENAAKCAGPRYFDPLSGVEKDNLIWMFMQSSIMDYAGELSQDLLGIGAWDFAAARMFYGDVVAVYKDGSYKRDRPRAVGVLDKMDNFGGIVGLQYVVADPSDGSKTIHYSQLQKEYELIKDCKPIDVSVFKPATWNEQTQGPWDPLLDGLIVDLGGKTYSRCRQQPVDYVTWSELSRPEGMGQYYGGGPSVTADNRLRVPYGFATDNWADLGNLSVYRHDNGADAYELFDFFITSQEVNHIFDNYRRNRHAFSVRGAANRTLSRYNEKMRDGAKGLGLMANIYRDFALETGASYDSLWPFIAKAYYADNILASSIAFDHFSRQLQRPQAGKHFKDSDGVFRAEDASMAGPPDRPVLLTVPNGAFGDNYRNMQYGGRLLENRLCENCGEYDSEYTMNCGSYYDKLYTPYLMTESVDNFISDSLTDFLDGRYRAVSLADLFPDGYRRWLANNLTGDAFIKGTRVATSAAGVPVKDPQGFITGIGWTRWTPADGPETCFSSADTLGTPDGKAGLQCAANPPANTAAIDPVVGWEQQKFLVAFTLLYLPENEQRHWLDMMSIWELGADSDPGFQNRIEFHHPSGRIYVAKTYGTEQIFGKTVQKGIAARVLEYANELLAQAYVVDAAPNGDWYIPQLDADGLPIVKFDPTIRHVDANGYYVEKPGCTATDSSECVCTDNRACVTLGKYAELPYFFRQAMAAYGMADPSMRGIY